MRDARPFVAHHLRQRADARMGENGAAIHLLARWVENLPARDPRMARIEATDALDYRDGGFTGGPAADALVDGYTAGDAAARDEWLTRFAEAVVRHYS